VRFSIVTPVFNGMPWLPESVRSVAAQRDTADVEHLVLDAGSSDGSREWLTENTALGYSFVSEPDEGQTDALVKGFARSSGEVLAWLNADDLLEPGALHIVEAAFGRSPGAVLVGGSCLEIDASGAVTGAYPTPRATGHRDLLLRLTNPPQPAMFFRRAAYERVGGLDRRYDLAMDVDLWLRLARAGEFAWLPDTVLARFRVHPAAKSAAGSTATAREDLRVRRRHGMPLRSRAGAALMKIVYVDPVVAPIKAAARRIAIRLFSP
jgi:glycosyltransferase involved in cell wall biosynthesis